jgi:hypothetical protein
VFAALLGVRKKLPFLPVGNVQRWLRGHIWLTLLTIPLILLHSGFRLGSPMTTTLMVLYAIVMVSGIYGLILQHKLPMMMKESLPAESVFEQIPNVRAPLCAAAEKLQRSLKQQATSGSAVVATDVSRRKCWPVSSSNACSRTCVLDAAKNSPWNKREADEIFRHLKLRATKCIDRASMKCGLVRGAPAHRKRACNWLHGWLFVHVPLSFCSCS